MQCMKDLIYSLTDIMSVSGNEYLGQDRLKELIGELFDEDFASPNGNHVFIKRCGKENAPLILLDAHFDEIGMMVREISDDGFLRVVPIGGLDTRVLLANEVIVYGNEKIYGVVCAKAPHLQKSDSDRSLPNAADLIIDTGYPKETLESKGVRIGTPIGYKQIHYELLNGQIVSKAFDDKCCIAVAVKAVERCHNENVDIALLCSVGEETSMLGAKIGGHLLQPTAAIAIDVNHAFIPGTDKDSTIPFGGGGGLSLSAVTHRGLTKAIIDFAKEKGIKYSTVTEGTSTGTNGNVLFISGMGIPTAVISVPLKYMHTCSEVISVSDCEDTAELIGRFIDEGGFEKWNV